MSNDYTRADRDWATKALARLLHGFGQVNIMDSATLDAIVREAHHHVCLPDKPTEPMKRRRRIQHNEETWSDNEKEIMKRIRKQNKGWQANYLFISESAAMRQAPDKWCSANYFVTPMAVIGLREVGQIRRKFYKDIPAVVEKACEILKIQLFQGLYTKYKENGQWDTDTSLASGVPLEVRTAFIEFAFQLPPEDRNPEADRELFKRPVWYSEDLVPLLMRLYERADTRFMEFMPLVKKKERDAVVAIVSDYPQKQQNQKLNTWLFGQGYHNVHLKPLKMYREDTPETFMKYFSEKSDDYKEKIIETIMRLDMEERREDIDAKLDEQFQPLLERVGVQYVEETPSDG